MDIYDWLFIFLSIFMFVSAFVVWVALRPNFNAFKEGTLPKYVIFFIGPLHLNIKKEKSWKRLNYFIVLFDVFLGIGLIYLAVT